jgi:hypothetical protein
MPSSARGAGHEASSASSCPRITVPPNVARDTLAMVHVVTLEPYRTRCTANRAWIVPARLLLGL